MYTNRDSFDFREYFSALLLRPAAPVPALQDESPGAAPPPQWPQAVFVASDSTHTHSALRRERAEHVERQWEARSRGEAAVLPPLPPFLAVPETRGRFLTEYGSHTVAGGYGICMKSRCGLPLEAMQRYDAEIDANGPSRAPRILGVVFDAAEDLHLLSRCSRLATTAASRYGVVAVALGWAATGGASVPATVFVDAATVASGVSTPPLFLPHRRRRLWALHAYPSQELQSGWIHWADPGLRRGQPGEQWRSFTRMFVEGLWTEDGAAKSAANAMPVAGSALPPPRLIHLRSFLPWVPPELLWAEALRWGGDDGEACSGSGAGETGEAAEPGVEGGCRVWHGECPLVSPPGTPLKLAIAAQINAGMRHLAHNHVAQVGLVVYTYNCSACMYSCCVLTRWYPYNLQAVSCWQTALGLLGLVEKQGLSNATAASISHRSGQAPDSADASGGTGSSGSGSGAVVEFSAAEASFLRGVAERNLASVAESDGWPYNRGSAEVAEMLARNVPAASDFASEWTRGGGAPAL